MKNVKIASLMICGLPRKVSSGRSILSASDAVWEPISHIVNDLAQYLTDEVGGEPASYAGAVQMTDQKLLDSLENLGLFACFRGVDEEYLGSVDVRNNQGLYQEILEQLELVGWDVCSGNGWLSASSHGVFPINPFDGTEVDDHIAQVNEFGLFESKADCQDCCNDNNTELPDHAPWFPVAVYIPRRAMRRLTAATAENC